MTGPDPSEHVGPRIEMEEWQHLPYEGVLRSTKEANEKKDAMEVLTGRERQRRREGRVGGALDDGDVWAVSPRHSRPRSTRAWTQRTSHHALPVVMSRVATRDARMQCASLLPRKASTEREE